MMPLRTIWRLAVIFSISFAALGQTSPLRDPLLEHMVGKWVLQGTIAGKKTTHDIAAAWVLGHQYLRIEEVSREKGADNLPAYDAMVLIGWDTRASEYTCLWLDNTGPWDFTSKGIGRGQRSGDAITFRFGSDDGSSVKTTFAWTADAQAWEWSIDNEAGGKTTPFARIRLTREARPLRK